MVSGSVGATVAGMSAKRSAILCHVACVVSNMEQFHLAVLVTLVSVLGQVAASGRAVLELTGDEPTIIFGEGVTLVHK